jgi:hypothetical protein
MILPTTKTLAALGVAAMTCALANAADKAPAGHTVTLDDFSRVSVALEAIDDRDVRGKAAGASFDVPAGRLLSIDRPSVAAVDLSGWFVVTRRDGQRLVGKPGEIRDDAIVLRTRSLGETAVPLPAIASIDAADGKHAAPPTPASAQDELRLTNGDVLQGIVASSTAEAVTVQSADGQSVPVEWRNVRRLRFAQTTDATKPAAGQVRVGLSDGTRVVASDLKLANGRVTFKLDGRACDVAMADVARIENLAGNVRLLADVAPSTVEATPYFPSSLGRPTGEANDRARSIVATGDAASAIVARPRSVMTWSLAGTSAARFHARYLIPPGLPQADVTIRVRADDRVLFERANVRSGETPAPIDVELGTAKSLTLEVDYGERYDVQDEFYWLDAALVAAPK